MRPKGLLSADRGDGADGAGGAGGATPGNRVCIGRSTDAFLHKLKGDGTDL